MGVTKAIIGVTVSHTTDEHPHICRVDVMAWAIIAGPTLGQVANYQIPPGKVGKE